MASRVCDLAENEVKAVSVSTPAAAHGFRSRDGDSPLPGLPDYNKGRFHMAYAILRFAKHKGGASKALSAHHERTKDSYASNPDIDLSRTAQNFHLVTPRWSYE